MNDYDRFYKKYWEGKAQKPRDVVKITGIDRDVEEGEVVSTEDLINHPAHYAEGREHEPIDVIIDWNLNYAEGNIVKYISRWRRKGGVEDLKKARFYINKLIESEEN